MKYVVKHITEECQCDQCGWPLYVGDTVTCDAEYRPFCGGVAAGQAGAMVETIAEKGGDTVNTDKLKQILDDHEKWLAGKKGNRADLRDADLRYADLRRAYLRGAYLRGADLRDAYLRGAYLSGADLRDAYLYGADLRGADLRRANLGGITVNWQSHALIAEILRRAAGDDVQRRMIAGLVAISEDWCWKQFLALDVPEKDWALAELRTWVKDNDGAPETLKEMTQ